MIARARMIAIVALLVGCQDAQVTSRKTLLAPLGVPIEILIVDPGHVVAGQHSTITVRLERAAPAAGQPYLLRFGGDTTLLESVPDEHQQIPAGAQEHVVHVRAAKTEASGVVTVTAYVDRTEARNARRATLAVN